MSSQASLYGVKPKPTAKPKPSASSLAFATSFSSLLASTAPNNSPATTGGRPRPSKNPKDSIFTAHNKGAQKRALADVSDGLTSQKHARTSEAVDGSTWQRSKRKMEEKARLYASMKRGDYVPSTNGGRDREAESLIDFDRKWAEQQDSGAREEDTASDDDSGNNESDHEETVEYEDEFGRLRTGTKADVAREQRRRAAQAHSREELAASQARPERPQNLIYGDTVQSAAFNPDEPIAAKMADLARKRDRSMTPPEETHYDASKEIRTKGVGFFQFSKDETERQREMLDLEREREETERGRREREERKRERVRKLEERKKAISAKRGEKLADQFLDSLDVP